MGHGSGQPGLSRTHSAARAVDRGKPIGFFATATRSIDGWELYLEGDLAELKHKFAPGVPFFVIPIEDIFAEVYRECLNIKFPEKSDSRARS